MAAPDFFQKILSALPRIGGKPKTSTRTFNPNSQDGLISVPQGRDHLNDLLTTRQQQNSRQLLESLFRYDTDFSAAVGAYLTLADTQCTILVHDYEGQIDPEATRQAQQIVLALTRTTEYKKFSYKRGFRALCQELRSMALLRGGIAGELVFNNLQIPERIQHVDMSNIEWLEKQAGVFTPQQRVPNTGEIISLDIPNFFVSYHRRLPTSPYPESEFVSAINTIAARQQVINDLYRIMRLTGYPRITIKVVEEIVRKNMPENLKNDPRAAREWLVARRDELAAQFNDLRADQSFVHYDSAEISILNKDKPGASMDISSVIDTLNAQNQAGLKTMATIIGRGTSGVNTASVEARIAAMNADQLNAPVAEFLEQALTFALNIYGTPGHVVVKFAPAELRPHLELEPQRAVRSARLKNDLSLGLITDMEYHLEMYGRLPPNGVKPLSGTNFEQGNKAQVDTTSISPNQDSLGRSVAPAGDAPADV